MESQLIYKVFDWLRFPLIVGVVFIHSFGKPFDYEALDIYNLSGIDCYNLFRVSVSKVLTHVCVPTFYFISGYLFFKGLESWNSARYKEKLKRRVKTLLIPFLIWNTICIFLSLQSYFRHYGMAGVLEFLSDNNYWHLYWDSRQWNLDRTNWLGGVIPASSPYLIPLWFLRDLMVVAICTPLLYYIFKKLKICGIGVLLLCYISGVFIPVSGFSTMAFLFFGLGAYMKMNNINPLDFTHRLRYTSFVIALITLVACTMLNGHETEWGNLIYPFYVISGVITLINIAIHLVKTNKLQAMSNPLLSRGSFFVYLSHTILILPTCKKVSSVIFGESAVWQMTIAYIAAPVMTVIICITLYFFIRRFTPSLCGILTGER
jgi:hypothetical protein